MHELFERINLALWDALANALQRMGLKSLRAQMFACLLGPILIITVISNILSYFASRDRANAVVDQMLIGSARMIGGSVAVLDSRHTVDIPPAAIENLTMGAGDIVYFRVDAPGSGLIGGTPELSPFAGTIRKEEWQSKYAVFREQEMRLVAFAQPVFPFTERDVVVIQVATTLAGRDKLVHNSWIRISQHQAILLLVAGLVGAFWTRAALAPVLRIGKEVKRRKVDDGTDFVVQGAPKELTPLVQSINDHVHRINHYINEHDRFISNAAHQLKTPLTVLNTQVAVGLRSSTLEEKQDALQAANETLRHCIHMTHQLLTLSAADHISGSRIPPAPMNLNDIVREVIENHAELAGSKEIDLGLVASGQPALISGVPILIETLVANLLDNAIRYTPAGGEVTAILKNDAGSVDLEVVDSGPGIPVQERGKVFERYYRLPETAEQDGCGLGLAIVQEIALTSKASLTLLDRPDGQPGLLVRVKFATESGDAPTELSSA